MNDPLTDALHAASEPAAPPPAPPAQPLGNVVPDLHDQVIAALYLPFFDGGIDDEPVPVITHTLLETGSIRVRAHRTLPAYDVVVTVDARTVKDVPDAPGRYELECAGHLHHSAGGQTHERAFRVPVDILGDGTLQLDVEAMRTEIAGIVRSFGGAA